MQQGQDPILTVVVGTYNRLDQIKRCIESIRHETSHKTLIVVTDAGSTDGTVDYLRQAAAPDLKPILAGRKLGQAKAYNDVFRETTSPYVAWLSDDNEVVNGGLDLAVNILERRRRIDMVGLKVRDRLGPFAKAPYIGGIAAATGILNVNQGVLRTQRLREVGYFSETFGFYGIDPDLTAKILYRGGAVVYTRPVAIHHYRNWPTDKSGPEWSALHTHHQKAEQIYRAKYAGIADGDPLWMARRWLWKLARLGLGKKFAINSHQPFAGLLHRDWHNVFAARHINVFDPLLTRSQEFHLRQQASPLARPLRLPPDPDHSASQSHANQA
jgi:GT2 family glycosyltransferase